MLVPRCGNMSNSTRTLAMWCHDATAPTVPSDAKGDEGESHENKKAEHAELDEPFDVRSRTVMEVTPGQMLSQLSVLKKYNVSIPDSSIRTDLGWLGVDRGMKKVCWVAEVSVGTQKQTHAQKQTNKRHELTCEVNR